MRDSKNRRPRRLPPGLVFGLCVIALGVAFLAHNLGRFDIEDSLRWWPALMVIAGIVHLINHHFFKVFGHVLLAGGTIALLDQLGYYRQAETWWPMSLVWIGLVVIGRAFWRNRALPVEPVRACQDVSEERHES